MKTSPLVLSLFPGIGLLDRAFEQAGFTIVRGPDLLWGGDVRSFTVPPGIFAGVIGGPPCQAHSLAGGISGSSSEDLIPEFVRVVDAAAPSFVVMENVLGAIGHPAIPPAWHHCVLRDWDCGGETSRTRAFWTWPMMVMEPGGRAGGEPSYSVMASSWRRGGRDSRYAKEKRFLSGHLPIKEYARLQGAQEIGESLVEHRSSKAFAVHVLGNGVPLSMGRHVARAVAGMLEPA